MKIIASGATTSSIVQLARSIDQRAAAEGREYLRLERGINGVCPIDGGVRGRPGHGTRGGLPRGDRDRDHPLALDYPDHPHPEERAAAGFTRPYDLDVERTADGGGGFWATLRHATPAGAVVRLELEGVDGAPLQVEMPRDRHEALALQVGERLYLRPRQVRVFLDA